MGHNYICHLRQWREEGFGATVIDLGTGPHTKQEEAAFAGLLAAQRTWWDCDIKTGMGSALCLLLRTMPSFQIWRNL